jgi:hypothetical protein
MSVLKRFLAMAGFDGGGRTIINVADPVLPQDAATKTSVQAAITTAMSGLQGLDTGLTIGGAGAYHFNVLPTFAVQHDGGSSLPPSGLTIGNMTSSSVPTIIISGGLSNG